MTLSLTSLTPSQILELKTWVETLWHNPQDYLSPEDNDILDQLLQGLDDGVLRVVQKQGSDWHSEDWLRQAILLNLRYRQADILTSPSFGYDKIPSKLADWTLEDFQRAGIRIVPGATVRRGAYVAAKTILMQSFINIGAHVGEGTLIDTWTLVGSCAYVGRHCHISAGVIIGGVLEPLQAMPVIIEDNCFIGAQSALTEGVIIEQGAVLGMGVHLSASTPLVHRETGTISYGRVPAYSVVIPGMIPKDNLLFPAGIIVKQVDEKTRAKTTINNLLRS